MHGVLTLVPLFILILILSSHSVRPQRFCPALRVIKLHSSDAEERERLKESLRKVEEYDVVVTTYEMVKSPSMAASLAGKHWWRCLVLDEVARTLG